MAEIISPAVVQIPIDELPHHLAKLETELEGGRTIEVVRGSVVIAELRGRTKNVEGPAVRPGAPDFMARMKAMWGDRVFDDSTQWIREDRDAQY